MVPESFCAANRDRPCSALILTVTPLTAKNVRCSRSASSGWTSTGTANHSSMRSHSSAGATDSLDHAADCGGQWPEEHVVAFLPRASRRSVRRCDDVRPHAACYAARGSGTCTWTEADRVHWSLSSCSVTSSPSPTTRTRGRGIG